MKEEFLHYIWKHELFDKENLFSINNEAIEIISPGTWNNDAGPDFINARIKINNTIWAGNIEIHTNSAMWQQHKHHENKAYNNVILHVVQKYNKPAYQTNGSEIPTIEIKFNQKLYKKYEILNRNESMISCISELKIVSNITWSMWLARLSIERLENKTDYISEILSKNNNSWEETFYLMLARNFGFKTNALPFELLAKATPIKIIAKYSANQKQLEAILFGQAGFFNEISSNKYISELSKEYKYLRKVHNLTPVENHLWKFLRLRPSNFPTIRIAQFASLIQKSNRLFSRILDIKSKKEVYDLFSCEVSEFWKTHYTFGKESPWLEKKMGKNAINGILINTIIPFLFIYGKKRGNPELSSRAINLLESLPVEKNTIISNWANAKVFAENASQSQALLQLTNNYCYQKNCLYCQVGNSIIQQKD